MQVENPAGAPYNTRMICKQCTCPISERLTHKFCSCVCHGNTLVTTLGNIGTCQKTITDLFDECTDKINYELSAIPFRSYNCAELHCNTLYQFTKALTTLYQSGYTLNNFARDMQTEHEFVQYLLQNTQL